VEELIDVGLSREERRARRHLRKHAADRPHVHRLAVRLLKSKDQQVTRTRTPHTTAEHTTVEQTTLTNTERATAQRRLTVQVVVAALKIVVKEEDSARVL